jgi:hypothetical protein
VSLNQILNDPSLVQFLHAEHAREGHAESVRVGREQESRTFQVPSPKAPVGISRLINRVATAALPGWLRGSPA